MSTIATHATSHVAHHFDDADQQYTAAELGMWVFIVTEILFFGGVFCAYAVYRYWYPAAFAEGSHHLDLTLGTINTAILLTSSLTMVLAVHAAQISDRAATVRNLVFTLLLGSAFLGIKAFEYHHKFEQHLVPGRYFVYPTSSNHGVGSQAANNQQNGTLAIDPRARSFELFFSFYFAMTGLHALHMVIGVGFLTVLIVAAARGAFSAAYFTPLEMFGLYWHFVDIVWVFLFPVLYLIPK